MPCAGRHRPSRRHRRRRDGPNARLLPPPPPRLCRPPPTGVSCPRDRAPSLRRWWRWRKPRWRRTYCSTSTPSCCSCCFRRRRSSRRGRPSPRRCRPASGTGPTAWPPGWHGPRPAGPPPAPRRDFAPSNPARAWPGCRPGRHPTIGPRSRSAASRCPALCNPVRPCSPAAARRDRSGRATEGRSRPGSRAARQRRRLDEDVDLLPDIGGHAVAIERVDDLQDARVDPLGT